MMYIDVIRLERTEEGSRGVLMINNKLFASTLELPWKNNERNISCIPTGTFRGRKYSSQRHGKTLIIEGVINRSGILFHVGNTQKDSQGCILLGDNFAKSSCAVESSTSAVERFKRAIKDCKNFTVRIRNEY